MWRARLPISRNGKECRLKIASTHALPASLTRPAIQLPLYSRFRVVGIRNAWNSTTEVRLRPPIVSSSTVAVRCLSTSSKTIRSTSTKERRESTGNDPNYDEVCKNAHREVSLRINAGDVEGAHAVLQRYHKQYGFHVYRYTYNNLLNKAIKEMNKYVAEEIIDYFSTWNIPYSPTTYENLLLWYSKINRQDKVEELWEKLKTKYPQLIDSHITALMLTNVRKFSLSKERVAEILQIVRERNIQLDEISYVDLFSYYNKLRDVNEFTKLFDEYMLKLSKGEVKSHPHIWQQTLQFVTRTRPRT